MQEMLSIPSLQMDFVFSHGDMQQFYEQYLGIQKRKEVIALKVKKLAKKADKPAKAEKKKPAKAAKKAAAAADDVPAAEE